MKKTILLSVCMLCMYAFASAQFATFTDDAVQGTGIDQHDYVGSGWVHGSNTPTFNNSTLSYSNVAGEYVTFTFDGGGISWYTEKKDTHGIVAISIDGGAETNIDLYSSTEEHSELYSSGYVGPGIHTFKIRITGTKNPASTNFYGIHDYIVTYPHPLESVDSTSTFAGAGSGSPVTPWAPLHNTGLGFNALSDYNDGGLNTAVGSKSLESSSGFGNTGVGFQSLMSNSGDGNTALGSYALFGDRENGGDYNTAVGSNSLQNSAASYNTAVGSFALSTSWPVDSHGDQNTALGVSSGPGVDNLSNTTSLGMSAKTTASNQVRIGNSEVTSIGGQVSWSTLSDGRFKRDLKEDVSGLAFVNKLRPVSYTIDKGAIQDFLAIPDSLRQTLSGAKEKPIRQTGFVAQEVEVIMKKSGYVFSGVDSPKNDKDPYGIRYAEFVVPLVKAVQELSAKNDDQQKQIDQLLTQLSKTEKSINELQSSEISLLQNNPNPFSVNTEIKMVLPESAINANIIVYNLEGKQLRDLQVKERGNASVNILGNELSAGMYIYALIVDGQVVDTKRMILTK